MFFHILKNGRIKNQGRVIGTAEGKLVVELFSWGDGDSTGELELDTNTVKMVWYATAEEWRANYANYLCHEDACIRAACVAEAGSGEIFYPQLKNKLREA